MAIKLHKRFQEAKDTFQSCSTFWLPDFCSLVSRLGQSRAIRTTSISTTIIKQEARSGTTFSIEYLIMLHTKESLKMTSDGGQGAFASNLAETSTVFRNSGGASLTNTATDKHEDHEGAVASTKPSDSDTQGHGYQSSQHTDVSQDELGNIAQGAVCLIEGETSFETPPPPGSTSAAIALDGRSPAAPPPAPMKKARGFRNVWAETWVRYDEPEMSPSHGPRESGSWHNLNPLLPLRFSPEIERFDPFKREFDPSFLK